MIQLLLMGPELIDSLEPPEPKPRRLYTALFSLGGLTLSTVGIFAIHEAPDVSSKIYGSLVLAIGAFVTVMPPVCYYLGDIDLSPHRIPPEDRTI